MIVPWRYKYPWRHRLRRTANNFRKIFSAFKANKNDFNIHLEPLNACTKHPFVNWAIYMHIYAGKLMPPNIAPVHAGVGDVEAVMYICQCLLIALWIAVHLWRYYNSLRSLQVDGRGGHYTIRSPWKFEASHGLQLYGHRQGFHVPSIMAELQNLQTWNPRHAIISFPLSLAFPASVPIFFLKPYNSGASPRLSCTAFWRNCLWILWI